MSKIDLIYNITAVCPHDCATCCVDAVHAVRQGSSIKLRSDGLMRETLLPRGDRAITIYDQAARHLQAIGAELDLAGKLRLIQNIDIPGTRLDISGGDPLCVRENLTVLRTATAKLGRANLTLTATGSGLTGYDLAEVGQLIGEYNFTFDSASIEDVAHRPKQYAASNFKAAQNFARNGSATRAEFPITRSTSSDDHLRRLYTMLHNAGIGKLLLMRLFPVGRGGSIANDILTPNEYRRAIAVLRALEHEFGSPSLKLQCALRHFETPANASVSAQSINPCDMVYESFGIMPNGTVLMSPWAINARGKPLDPMFVLGNLSSQSLSSILMSPKVAAVRRRAHENFGHCKIFTFLHSPKGEPMERLFDAADPLYLPTDSVRVA